MEGPTADSADRLAEPFRFAYDAPTLRCGRGAVDGLGEELAGRRALVITGRTVGTTPAVIDPVRAGLGDALAGVFAETTPEKRLSTATDAVRAMREADADAIVALGGGSSLDAAKQASVLAARSRDRPVEAAASEARAELSESGTIEVPDGGLVPVLAVPTTLAGADVSQVAGVTADVDGGETASGGISDPGLMPAAVVSDPDLVATTPRDVLAASAMNGFDKGIETLYAATATPVTDATAMRGLSLFRDGLLAFGSDPDPDPWVFDALVRGVVLVQYGISRPDAMTLSIIHAFGHGLTRTYPVQQGAAHAVIAPHVLSYLFEQTDARRDLLAAALGVADAEDPAGGVVAAVTEVRDALDLPARLRDVEGPDPEAFSAVADAVLADSFMETAPPGLDPTRAEIERVLEAAW